MTLEVVVTRSARLKEGASAGKAIVVAPFADAAFATSPGGDGVGTREYDPGAHSTARETIPAPLELSFRQGTVTSTTDALATIVYPSLDASDPPVWVTSRGHEARAFDRRRGREVFGPHWFDEPSDIIVTNGIVRFWVMAADGSGGCLAVSAVNDGAWHHVGYLVFDEGGLTSARIVALTPDRVVLVVTVAGEEARVECRRGERMIRVSGAGVGWSDVPAAIQRYGTLPTGVGRFRDAVDLAAEDLIEFPWPAERDAWAFAGWWIPAADSATQGDSGIWYARDTSALVSTLMFRDGALEWTQDGDTLTAAPEFDAGEPVFVALSYSASVRRLTVRPQSGAPAHVTDVVGPGTAEDNLAAFVLAPLFGDLGGYDDIYSDTYDFAGVGTWAFDNAMVFGEELSAAEAVALGAGATGLAGLPSPESRLAWFASFDDPDSSGLVSGTSGVGDDTGAFLALAGATYDAALDHAAQFRAESEQQIRVR